MPPSDLSVPRFQEINLLLFAGAPFGHAAQWDGGLTKQHTLVSERVSANHPSCTPKKNLANS